MRGTAATSTSLLRKTNAEIVLATLYDGRAWSVRELQSHTGLSRPTVDAVADALIARGLVRSVGTESLGVGRPARRLEFCASAGYVAGVDVGRTSVRVTVTDLLGQPLSSAAQNLTTEMTRRRRLAVIQKTVANATNAAGLSETELMAISVGTPGAVDPETGAVGMCKVLSGWSDFPLRDHLSDMLDTAVTVENDANLAAIAEHWRGEVQDCANAIMLLVGQRPGAGIINNHEITHGHQGWVGELFLWELWHQFYAQVPNAPLSNVAAQVRALRAQLVGPTSQRANRTPPFRDTGTANIDLNGAFAALKSGDRQAAKAVERFVNGGAWVVTTMASLLGPERIVVSGIPEPLAPTIIQIWQDALGQLVPGIPTELAVSALGDDAVVLGAVRRALDAAHQQLVVHSSPG